jgi:acyl carrier protein
MDIERVPPVGARSSASGTGATVTRDELRGVVVAELRRIAPELDPKALRLDAPLRDQVDIDSMDFLNFIVALHGRVGDSWADYSKLSSVGALVAYVEAKLGARWTRLRG